MVVYANFKAERTAKVEELDSKASYHDELAQHYAASSRLDARSYTKLTDEAAALRRAIALHTDNIHCMIQYLVSKGVDSNAIYQELEFDPEELD